MGSAGSSSGAQGSHFVQVRVLGPFEVLVDGRPVRLTQPRLQVTLAVLAMAAGEVTSIDRITDAVWGEQPPENARGAVHICVHRLRTALGAELISTEAGGYRFVCPPEQVDALQLLRLTRNVPEAGAGGRRAELEEAVGLWRGAPFTGIDSAFLERIYSPRLVDAYLTAVERMADLDLADERLDTLSRDLHGVVAQHPYRESLWARLLVVLRRTGRQNEALELYEQVRARLAEQLGTDPGPELRQLHAELIRDTDAAGGPDPEVRQATPRNLPAGISRFVGRRAELDLLDSLLHSPPDDPARLAVIHGTGGVGKTTLALHWAHQVRDRFHDGQLFVDLRGYGPGDPMEPLTALDLLLRALGLPADQIPPDLESRSGMLRTMLTGRDVLVVLDNARDAEQVRPLLPGRTGVVLVTSRSQLRGLVAREGARRIDLDRLSAAEARVLLAAAARSQELSYDDAILDELAELCDRLPLALAIAAERFSRGPASALNDLVAELRNKQTRLDALDTADDPLTSIRAVLAASYSGLDRDTARTYRLLSLQPAADICGALAAALVGVPLGVARRQLDRLVGLHLLQPLPGDRYQMHDLIRAYGAELAAAIDSEADRTAAVGRALNSLLVTARNAFMFARPSVLPVEVPAHVEAALEFESLAAAMTWAETERTAVMTWVRLATDSGHWSEAWRLAWFFRPFLELSRHFGDGVRIAQLAVEASDRLGEPAARFRSVILLGVALQAAKQFEAGQQCFERGLKIARESGDRLSEVTLLSNLATSAMHRGDLSRGTELLHSALDLMAGPARPGDGELGLRIAPADLLLNLGVTYFLASDQPNAIKHTKRALAEARASGDWFREAQALCNLAEEHEALGDLPTAESYCDQTLARLEGLTAADVALGALTIKGRVLAATGRTSAAYRVWNHALAVVTGNNRHRAQLVTLLDTLDPTTAPTDQR